MPCASLAGSPLGAIGGGGVSGDEVIQMGRRREEGREGTKGTKGGGCAPYMFIL
jgi:hypothetical protein